MKLHIDRLDLELHGDIAPATVQEAARLLGPALAEALHSARPIASTGTSLHVAAQIDAAALAQQLARQLAPRLATHLAARGAAPAAAGSVAATALPIGPPPLRRADGPASETKRRN